MATRKLGKTLLCYHLALIDHKFLLKKKTVPTVENWQNTALQIKIVSKCGVLFSAFWVLFRLPILFQSNPVISISFPSPLGLFVELKVLRVFWH
jgi:hypothetical protein